MRLARGLLLTSLLSAFIATAAAASAARTPTSEDGTLTVRDGRGAIAVRLNGSVIGRLGKGTLAVTETIDGATVVVRGHDRPPLYRGLTTVYTGNNIRFRIAHDRRVAVRLNGKGLNFSAVGRGDGWMDGLGDPAAGIFFDGSYSLNGEPYHSLPDIRTRFELILPPPPPEGASSPTRPRG